MATAAEIGNWDELIVANPDGGHVLQTRAWGESKFRQGWRPRYWIAQSGERDIAVLALIRAIPGLGNLAYCPKGPGVQLIGELTAMLEEREEWGDIFCLKVEPELADNATNRNALRRAHCLKVADVQINRATIVIDLRSDEPATLKSFKAKTRYNIRLAARKGVSIEPVPCREENLHTFFGLYAETARRAQFALRPQHNYERYWRLLEASGQGQLFFARHEGEIIAGAFVAFLGRKGWYKDGGSSRQHRELMAPHLLQWEVMRWLRARGIESYDLVAVPRRSELSEAHALQGLWRFKSGFSEEITEFVGAWDLPLHPRRYRAWRRFGEPLALRLSWRLNGDLFY